MNRRMILYILGYVLKIETALMLVPLLTAVIYKEKEGYGFLITSIISLVLGLLMTIKKPKTSVFYLKEGCLITSFCWIIMSIFGCLPFVFSGEIPRYIDALFEIVRARQGGKEQQNVMGQLRQYIDSNISRQITNGELGEAMGYNPNYLNRLVLGSTGMSLHQYVLQRRLTLARGLLVTTRQPVSDIAISLGFHSAAHFSY